MITIKNKLIVAAMFMSMGFFHQTSTADAVVAVGANGQVQIYNEGATVVSEDAKKEAVRLCHEKGGLNCKVIGELSGDQAAVVARGNDGGIQISADANPEAALKKAIAVCNERYGNCHADFITWLPYYAYAAFATYRDEESRMAHFFSYNYGNEEEAKEAALTECRQRAKHDCVISGSWNREMFYASAQVGNDGPLGLSVTPNPESSKVQALKSCQKSAAKNDVCKIKETFHNPGPKAEPKNFRAVYKKIMATHNERGGNNGSVRTRTESRNVLTCHNQCMNGDCVRTFPDGRKERWQAPRVYDPFTNDWKWETSSCGG